MSVATSVPRGASRTGSIAIIGGLFFVFGFVTWLNGPLIAFAKLAFDVSESYAFLIPSAFYISYFCLALPASLILKATGMKKGMALGLFTMAVGAVAFGQFTMQRWYPGALGGVFVIGAGLALLQTAVNPYISILGPIDSAAQRIAVMGICNKFAGMIARLILAGFVLHGMSDIAAEVAAADPARKAALLDEFAGRIHGPYLGMAVLLALLAVAILFSPLPDLRAEDANATSRGADGSERLSLFQFPHVWLGALCIFVYVGAEVMAGDAIGIYGQGFGISLDITKYFTGGTLACMLVGYIVGLLLIPRVVSQERYLRWSAVMGIVFAVGAYLTHGYVSVAFVALLGLANAMMWPAIFPLAIRGLGRLTEAGSALLVMGIAGGAVIPQLFAALKQHYDFQAVFSLLMVACYLYILFYARRGYRVGMPAAA